jgi:hypothetical protein
VFPPVLAEKIEAFNATFDKTYQIPGFAAFSPNYFSSGVISSDDEQVFRSIVARATGSTVEDNEAQQLKLVIGFWESLRPLLEGLGEGADDWLFGPFSYADILLLSCIKCFATVMRGVVPVLGKKDGDLAKLHSWYARIHEVRNIKDPY